MKSEYQFAQSTNIWKVVDNLNQLSGRLSSILKNEGFVALKSQFKGRVRRKPLLVNAYVLAINFQDMSKVQSTIEVDIREETGTNQENIKTLADFGFYGDSAQEILQHFADGQRCWIAQYKGQTVACYWIQRGGFYDPFLKRRIEFAENEEYHLGAFTLPEFRGKGIFPYLKSHSSFERPDINPNDRLFIIVRANNKPALAADRKLGFTKVGRIGFIEVLGIRFHFLLGREAFPKTQKRMFIQFFG